MFQEPSSPRMKARPRIQPTITKLLQEEQHKAGQGGRKLRSRAHSCAALQLTVHTIMSHHHTRSLSHRSHMTADMAVKVACCLLQPHDSQGGMLPASHQHVILGEDK